MLNALHFYRFANLCGKRRIPFVPRLIDLINRLVFQCWLPHEAELGRGVILGYGGLSIVIDGACCIGERVQIGQCVTIGGNATEKGSPVIEADVYIGAGAKILGPIRIGRGTIVGANAVVIADLPPRCVAVGVPARIVRTNVDIDQFLFQRRTSDF